MVLRGNQRFLIAIIMTGALLCTLTQAKASIVVTVDKSAQRLTVSVDGHRRFAWPVSTARMGYRTPNGSYRPERLERQWFSRKYDWSPMPHSIFFNGGYAIHGSYEISRLGTPASHGCIRLHPANAAMLYSLVQGRVNDTRIIVTGEGYEPKMVERVVVRRASRNFEEVFTYRESRRRWDTRY
jgi:L,D-transpeptidase catalytic domain